MRQDNRFRLRDQSKSLPEIQKHNSSLNHSGEGSQFLTRRHADVAPSTIGLGDDSVSSQKEHVCEDTETEGKRHRGLYGDS